MIYVGAFLFAMLSCLLGPAVLVFGSRLRPNAFVCFPVAIALNLGFLGGWAPVLHRSMANGWGKWGLLLCLGFVCTGASFKFLKKRLVPTSRDLTGRTLLLLAFLAVGACLDIGVIFSKNGWSEPDMVPYFRPPLHNDSVRNVVLIEALDRKGESPYFAGAPIAYQVFWHHLFGSFIFPFRPVSHYSTVAGLTATNAVLMYFLLFWALAMIRPGWLRNRAALGFFWLLAAAHADIWHFLTSLVEGGKLGIEADWSAERGFFSSFSIKLVALTSPQHALWAALTATWLALTHRTRSLKVDALFLPLGFLVSPVLSLFFVPLQALFSWVRLRFDWKFIIERVCLLIGAIGLYWLVFENPASLFLRNLRGGSAQIVPLAHWIKLPIALVGSVGTAGLWATIVLFRSNPKRVWRRWEFLYLTLGTCVIAYATTDSEVRRHLSIVLSLVVPLFLILTWRRAVGGVVVAVASLTVALHGYFLYCYLGKPSRVDPSIPWGEYFALNPPLRGPLRGTSVLSAADPQGTGIEMPVVMEATTSFSLPEHAAIHSKLSPVQRDLIVYLRSSSDRVPWLVKQGYETVVWGPVENRIWGDRIRKRFIGEEVLRQGTVSLHRLTDKLAPRLEQVSVLRKAELLAVEGWDDEALEAFGAAASENPKDPRALLGMAELFLSHSNPRAAFHLSEEALSLSPDSRVARGIQERAREAME